MVASYISHGEKRCICRNATSVGNHHGLERNYHERTLFQNVIFTNIKRKYVSNMSHYLPHIKQDMRTDFVCSDWKIPLLITWKCLRTPIAHRRLRTRTRNAIRPHFCVTTEQINVWSPKENVEIIRSHTMCQRGHVWFVHLSFCSPGPGGSKLSRGVPAKKWGRIAEIAYELNVRMCGGWSTSETSSSTTSSMSGASSAKITCVDPARFPTRSDNCVSSCSNEHSFGSAFSHNLKWASVKSTVVCQVWMVLIVLHVSLSHGEIQYECHANVWGTMYAQWSHSHCYLCVNHGNGLPDPANQLCMHTSVSAMHTNCENLRVLDNIAVQCPHLGQTIM